MTPLVSVVIPTLGRPQMLARAVASVLNQTMGDFELIIVIDGPDPATAAYLATLSDPRVTSIQNSKKTGAGPARDRGALAGVGTWVAFLDDDDEWLPTKLQRQLKLCVSNDVVCMTMSHVKSDGETVVRPVVAHDPRSRAVDEWLFDRPTWFGSGGFLQTSSLMCPRQLFDQIKFEDTSQHEEWELVIRAVKERGYRLVTVTTPEVVYYVPTGRSSLSNSYSWSRSLEWVESMQGVLSPRAISGFCLVASSRLAVWSGVRRPPLRLLSTAFRLGRPTPKQLLAFSMIWLVPASVHAWSRKLRLLLAGSSARSPALSK